MSSSTRISNRPPIRLALLLVAVATLATSCAYFNMLYNAKQRFKEAQSIERPRDGEISRAHRAAYDEVIEKCQTMIGTYPNSRHVDDAMLLIARCLYGEDRFQEAVAQLDSLEAKFPKTELLPKVRFYKGQALAVSGEYEAAVDVLSDYVNRWGGHEFRADALYYLATCQMRLGREDGAMQSIALLDKHHGDSQQRLDAQLEVAAILAEDGSLENSLRVYEQLTARRIPENVRYRVWMGMAEVYERLGRHQEALALTNQLEELQLLPEEEPPMLLLEAKAYGGLDSLDAQIRTYNEITRRFSRGEYAADAFYQLGLIYEKQDSLNVAKTKFEAVPRAYANSEYATDAIRRAGSISKLLKLQEAEDDESPEALALREFTMAELQLFQFENTEKAIASYQLIVDEYPDTEYAPKAAYALGYIYGELLGDEAGARRAYRVLQERYPNSQQAVNARSFMVGRVTSGSQPMPTNTLEDPPRALRPDSTAAIVPSDTTSGDDDGNE